MTPIVALPTNAALAVDIFSLVSYPETCPTPTPTPNPNPNPYP